MEPTPRLYQCVRCHTQAVICTQCDHGQIYCGNVCAALARKKSMQLAGIRYQTTFRGKRNHAARQTRYRKRLSEIVTHQGSPSLPPHALMDVIENVTKKTVNEPIKALLTCCFCKKPISDWFRNDFLRRRSYKKSRLLHASPQAP